MDILMENVTNENMNRLYKPLSLGKLHIIFF